MDIGDDYDLEHLLFKERECRVCGQTKILIEDFYRTRKDRGTKPSSYSYECKDCTKKRILESKKKDNTKWHYPDW